MTYAQKTLKFYFKLASRASRGSWKWNSDNDTEIDSAIASLDQSAQVADLEQRIATLEAQIAALQEAVPMAQRPAGAGAS